MIISADPRCLGLQSSPPPPRGYPAEHDRCRLSRKEARLVRPGQQAEEGRAVGGQHGRDGPRDRPLPRQEHPSLQLRQHHHQRGLSHQD